MNVTDFVKDNKMKVVVGFGVFLFITIGTFVYFGIKEKELENKNTTYIKQIKEKSIEEQKQKHKDIKGEGEIKKKETKITKEEKLKNTIGIKEKGKKVLTGKVLKLNDISNDDFLLDKQKIKNFGSIDKDSLTSIKKELLNIKIKLIRDRIKNKRQLKERIKMDKEKIRKIFNNKNIILISPEKILGNLVTNKIKVINEKCFTWAGEKKCNKVSENYVKYKDIYIPYKLALAISKINSKKNYIFLVYKRINKKNIAYKHLVFNKRYGWYGYKALEIFSKSLKNNS